MTLHTVTLLNGILDLGIVVALAATMRIPFTLDSRRRHEAHVYAFAAPLPDKLAA